MDSWFWLCYSQISNYYVTKIVVKNLDISIDVHCHYMKLNSAIQSTSAQNESSVEFYKNKPHLE